MKLSPKQEKFVANYIETRGNGTQSAIQAGYSERSAHVASSRLLKNDKIVGVLEEKQADLWQTFKEFAEEALLTQIDIMRSEEASFKTRLDATNSILDRAGFKPNERTEVTGVNGGAIQFESKITSELAQRARQLLAEKNS